MEVAVSIGIMEFNEGSHSLQQFMETVGLDIGEFCAKFGARRDASRKRQADRDVMVATKKRRDMRRQKNIATEALLVSQEGGPQYEAGSCNF